MNRIRKVMSLLLCGLLLSTFVSCFPDKPPPPQKTSRLESRQTNRFESRRAVRPRQGSYSRPIASTPLRGPWKHKSNLPLVIIDTNGRWIPDDPKVPAQLKIIYDESGGKNGLDSNHIHFEGKIGIELRGKTSQGFPKRQYGFEFQDKQGNDKDVSIFGLPAESDWILHGPYSDKTLMRNYLAFEFSNRIGRYASRTQFVEVFLNNSRDKEIQAKHYVGVYLLLEKIKRGTHRVDIKSLKPTHNEPPEITGGYIIKIDKIDHYDSYFFTHRGTQLTLVYPKRNEITFAQKTWIRNYMNKFENVLAGPDFKDPEKGYAKYIDIDSHIDHFIINELFKNTDGFRFSAYMYIDRDGKLQAGPVWDFNLSMGNTVFHNSWTTYDWLIYTNPVPFWWHRLVSDEKFKQKLVKRWKELRKNELATSAIINEVDQTVQYLSEAQKRNFNRWRVLGRTTFGNPGPGYPTYHQEVEEMKIWLKTRIEWMDENIERLPQKYSYARRYRY
ncbi:hypothetical protein F4X73_04210 [Candidatus Poribacteria bacterium]|nr:hypothetical protein [Candidatus Poribacteria bacterium]